MMVQSSTSDPENKVAIWASTDSDDPGKLKLMLVNLSGDNASAQVKVKGFQPASGQAYVMESEDPLSMRDSASYTEHSTTINGVAIPDYEISKPAAFRKAVDSIKPVDVAVSRDFDYSIPPYSVVALTLEGRAGPPEAPPPAPSPDVNAALAPAAPAVPAPEAAVAPGAVTGAPAGPLVAPAMEGDSVPAPAPPAPPPAPAPAVPERPEQPALPPVGPVKQEHSGTEIMRMLASRHVDRRPQPAPTSKPKTGRN
jgi:hypothetical protein